MKDTRKDILWRIYLVYFFMCLFGLSIIVKISRLQFTEGDFWRSQADSLTTEYKKIEPVRGNIYSINENLLATSVPVYELRIDFTVDVIQSKVFNDEVDSLAENLSILFGDKSKTEYKRLLKEGRKNKERYMLLKRNVTYSQLKQVRQFPVFNKGRYKGGLIAEQKSKRELPYKFLAARTIGYRQEGVAPVGLEGSFDQFLKGSSGMRLMQRLSGGVWKPLNDENEVEPVDGHDIFTSIDIAIQDVAENSLMNQLQKNNAEGGCAILMEVATGEIRAIANLKRREDGIYGEYYNSAIGQSTEPGSTFKLMSLLAAIEDGKTDLDDSVDTKNGICYWTPGRPMKDSHENGYGKISVKHAFEVSSNVGISKVVYKAYAKDPQAFVDRLHKMGIDKPLGLQLSGEGKPFINETKNKTWSSISLPYMSIGYECRLTPLQILTFYNAIANNGRMVKPLFVKELRLKGKTIKRFPTEVISDSILSAATIAKAKLLLEGVVQNGTASGLKSSPFPIAGKTGTARVAYNSEGYEKEGVKYQASFVGYFPADRPKYSCMVVVYAPSNDDYYAAKVAAPIFRDIADKVYATNIEMHDALAPATDLADNNLPVPKPGLANDAKNVLEKLNVRHQVCQSEYSWFTFNRNAGSQKVSELKIKKSVLPDLTGMGMRDAVYLLESMGLQIKAIGAGSVIRQSVPAGATISKGESITIELS